MADSDFERDVQRACDQIGIDHTDVLDNRRKLGWPAICLVLLLIALYWLVYPYLPAAGDQEGGAHTDDPAAHAVTGE